MIVRHIARVDGVPGSQGGELHVDSSAAICVAERRAGATWAGPPRINGDAATHARAAPSRINGEAVGGLCEQPKIQG